MFSIIITCLTVAHTCVQPPILPAYETMRQCEISLLAFAHSWRPVTGNYKFNCEGWI